MGYPECEVELPMRGGALFRLAPSQAEALRGAHPEVDIAAELRRAAAWLLLSPESQRNKGFMATFISGWIKRADPRFAPTSQAQGPQAPVAIAPEPGGEGYEQRNYAEGFFDDFFADLG